MPRTPPAIEDGALIQIARGVEHQEKNVRIRSSVSASASTSSTVV